MFYLGIVLYHEFRFSIALSERLALSARILEKERNDKCCGRGDPVGRRRQG